MYIRLGVAGPADSPAELASGPGLHHDHMISESGGGTLCTVTVTQPESQGGGTIGTVTVTVGELSRFYFRSGFDPVIDFQERAACPETLPQCSR
jgi:hypothetical protein